MAVMPSDRSRPDDRPATLAAVFAFSLGLGIGTIAVPLVALAAGYDPPAVGFLAAVAATTQLGTRLVLPWALGRWRDRSLMIAGCLALAGMFGLLLTSTALPVFIAAQVLQGTARSMFWTSSQTHAVRGPGSSVRRLVDLNVAGNLGTLSGPAIAGMLALVGLPLALGAAVVAAAIGAACSLRLQPLEAFDRSRSAGTLALIGRPGVDVACWAGIIGGAWWAMLGSFVPVLLVGAGFGPAGVGWLVTASEGAGMVALLLQRGVSGRTRIRRRVVLAGIVVAGALAALALGSIALGAAAIIPSLAFLVVGGAASGTVTTLGPALASLAAGPDEQGDALALQGTFRATALLGAPAGVGVLVTTIALAPALVVLAGAILVPGLVIRARGAPEAPAAVLGTVQGVDDGVAEGRPGRQRPRAVVAVGEAHEGAIERRDRPTGTCPIRRSARTPRGCCAYPSSARSLPSWSSKPRPQSRGSKRPTPGSTPSSPGQRDVGRRGERRRGEERRAEQLASEPARSSRGPWSPCDGRSTRVVAAIPSGSRTRRRRAVSNGTASRAASSAPRMSKPVFE